MDEKQKNDELSQWFSTYGLITAERILGSYQISIPQTELIVAVKSPTSFYHQLLQVPLKNVLNGIVLQQANDYHIYAQKLFIDYLLSGESSKGEESQGALTRENLENERKKLVNLGEDYHKLQLTHDALIANSQSSLIQIAKEWKVALESGIRLISTSLKNNNFDIKNSVVRHGVNNALIYCDFVNSQADSSRFMFIDKMNEVIKAPLNDELKQTLLKNLSTLLDITLSLNSKISDFFGIANEINEQAVSYRTQFFETILRINELMILLPDYKINPVQDVINRESLNFDKTIGER